jgi:hypothetical protein
MLVCENQLRGCDEGVKAQALSRLRRSSRFLSNGIIGESKVPGNSEPSLYIALGILDCESCRGFLGVVVDFGFNDRRCATGHAGHL